MMRPPPGRRSFIFTIADVSQETDDIHGRELVAMTDLYRLSQRLNVTKPGIIIKLSRASLFL
ncbi:MAG: hypothetical protein KJ065_17350 [Anaerolineae bacterium]|nr:hypothetical protein [Anaerolineae bacterium]